MALAACSSSSFEVASTPESDSATTADTGAVADDTSVINDSVADDTSTPPDDTTTPPPDVPIDMGPPCDSMEAPPTDAIFVSAAATSGDGTNASPFRTITEGVNAARTKKLAKVVVDQGLYGETVKLTDSDPGIVIEGAWTRTSGIWKRNCDTNARALTVIQGVGTGVFADGVVHLSGLRHLTVKAKSSGTMTIGGPGESIYGVRVRGATSKFALDDVAIEIEAGGKGTTGPAMIVTAPACNGISDCNSGMPGVAGSKGTLGKAGTYTADGYLAGDGGAGGVGSPGANGTAGSVQTVTCVNGCTEGCLATISCKATATEPRTSTGKCGCGGQAGAAGGAGGGGGASIALYVHGSGAKVTIARSALRAGNGGAGAPGGLAGDGVDGSVGSEGPSTTCSFGCSAVMGGGGCGAGFYACVKATMLTAVGGMAGGKGGKGGAGGEGGGGSGGPSHAIVMASGADVGLDAATMLTNGTGGAGQGGAPNGTASPKITAL
jgi:hypothetical protein